MATLTTRQWLRPALLLLALLALPEVARSSWECGPGYHKPTFGRCVPDAGRPLLRTNRYAINERGIAPRFRAAPGPIAPLLPRPERPWR